MEHESSIPHSQVPATCPYPEPVRSSPYPHNQHSQESPLYFPPIYVCVSQVAAFKFPHQNPVYASPLPHTRYMPYRSYSCRFLSPERYWLRSTNN